jgi:4-carboxymuconolactone decarboxylase
MSIGGRLCIMTLMGLTTLGGSAQAQDRLPTIPPSQYNAEQKVAAAQFEAARKTAVFGPFEPMMHSPQLMSDARAMGIHYPIAIKAGLRPELLDAIAAGKRPAGMSGDEDIVYTFTLELLKKKQVSDGTFERAKNRFGTRGVVDMAGISGYYSFLAMQLNVANYQTVVKDGKKLPPLAP